MLEKINRSELNLYVNTHNLEHIDKEEENKI